MACGYPPHHIARIHNYLGGGAITDDDDDDDDDNDDDDDQVICSPFC